MRKALLLSLCLALVLALAGCGGAPAPEATAEPAVETPSTPAATAAPEGVDVDLTALSATMVYAEVFHMVSAPEDYVGKTVKMGGAFAHYHDEATGGDYFACIVQDATACCAQGIEFVLAGEHSYPEDYPAPDTEICVTGVFDTYQEDGCTYCTLREARLL